MAGEHRPGVVELTDDSVVPDSGQADLGFVGGRGVTDEHDVALRRQDVASPLGEATLETDVQRPAQVSGGEVGGLAAVEQDGAGGLAHEYLLERQHGRRVVVEQRAQLAVALGIELEVLRPSGCPSVTAATKSSSDIGCRA